MIFSPCCLVLEIIGINVSVYHLLKLHDLHTGYNLHEHAQKCSIQNAAISITRVRGVFGVTTFLEKKITILKKIGNFGKI